MYRIFKQFTKNPKHLRVLRHVFGVPAEDPPTRDFLDAILERKIPENIDEMEFSPPMFDLLLMKDTRLQGAKILCVYFFGKKAGDFLDRVSRKNRSRS